MIRLLKLLKFINWKNICPRIFILAFATVAVSAVTGCNFGKQKKDKSFIFLNDSDISQSESISQVTDLDELNNKTNKETECPSQLSYYIEEKYGSTSKKEEFEITLKTKDCIERKGILSIHANAKGNVILCHPASYEKGFMENFDKDVFKDYNCLRFDFRRHGENNKNQYSTLGKYEVLDVEAAIEFIKCHPKTKDLPTFGFGISLGAAVLIETAAKDANKFHFDGLILQSSFDRLGEQIKRTYKFFSLPLINNLIFEEPIRSIAKIKYRLKLYKVNPVKSIEKIKTPIFLIHARNDNYIKFEAFEALYKAGKRCIAKTWTPEGGFHTKIFNTYPVEYAKHCNDFLSKIPQYKVLLKINEPELICSDLNSIKNTNPI